MVGFLALVVGSTVHQIEPARSEPRWGRFGDSHDCMQLTGIMLFVEASARPSRTRSVSDIESGALSPAANHTRIFGRGTIPRAEFCRIVYDSWELDL